MGRKPDKKKKRTSSHVQGSVTPKPDGEDQPGLKDVIQEMMLNRPGVIGFFLSLLQLFGHTCWILLVWYLSVSGKATELTDDSWLSWLIVGILGISLVLTFVSLFVCLFYGLRKSPRVLAAVGFFLSFFVGVLASAIVFMQGLRAIGS